MISVYYLFEKLSVNQHIWANTELERRLNTARKEFKSEKKKGTEVDPKTERRYKKLVKARDRASENASAEAWKREPEFMKDQQKDPQARRLRRAAYGQTTRPDLQADLARKLRMGQKKVEHRTATFKKKAASLGTAVAKGIKTLTQPVPALGAPVYATARSSYRPKGKPPTPGKVIPYKRPNVPDADIIRRRRRKKAA